MRTGSWVTYAVGLAGVALLLGCSGGITPGTTISTDEVFGATPSVEEHLCELCLKPIVEAFAVVLEPAGDESTHMYRCIHCALVAARDRSKGDLRLRAASAVGGRQVEWDRREGSWEVRPASALVVALPEANDECLGRHVVLADRSEFEAYAKEHKEAGAVQPFAAADTARILSGGKPADPEEAKCPVSGETVRVNDDTPWTVYKGDVYYFCCAPCKPRFLGDPEGYLTGTAPRPQLTEAEGGCGGAEAGQSGSCGATGGSKEGGGGGCDGASVDSTLGDGETQQPTTDEPVAPGD